MSKLYNRLDTGDLLLFRGNAIISCCIECLTCSNYSHVGMVLKDPTFINEELVGLYLWQSGQENFPDAENHIIFNGVQISPLDKVIKYYGIRNVYIRKLIVNTPLEINLLKKIHYEIHHHKYDMNVIDWLMAGIYQIENWSNIDESDKNALINNTIPKSVWCSALIGYIYYRLNLISNKNWRLLSPEDWSFHKNSILGIKNCLLTQDIKLKKFLK